MEKFLNKIWINFDENIYNDFKFEEYILLLKMQGLTYESQRYYLKYIKNFISEAKFTKISDFNNLIKLRFWYLWLSNKDISNNTIAKYYKCIRKYYIFLKEIWLVDKILIDNLQKVKQNKPLPKSLSEEEVIIIRNKLKSKNKNFLDIRDYIILETFINTWIRRSELQTLKINDVTKNYIKITSWKWNKDRVVFLSSGFSRLLNDYVLYIKEKFNYQDDNLLFWLKSSDGVSTVIKRISRYTNIKFHPHLLRHTYASISVKKWVNLYTLQQQMWHTDLKTTSIYLYLNWRENLQEVQKVQI